jgi:hypothetical protein
MMLFLAAAARRISAPTLMIRQVACEVWWQLRPRHPALSPCPQTWPAPEPVHLAQAIYGFEADDVLTANIGDGAANVCLAVGTLAEFASDIRGEARIRWLGHHSQRSHNLVIEKHIEVRRLAQRNAKRLLYGVIENRIASGVGKIPNDNHVLFGKLGSSSARVIKIACRRENSDQ